MRLLLAAFVFLVALHFVPGRGTAVRNYEFFPDMVESVAYESQDENPNFADGKNLQRPPEGTIARGYLPLLLDTMTPWKELTPEQQAAWNGLVAPPADERALARGATVFGNVCATCHGQTGAGDGPTTKRGVPPPLSFLGQGAREMSAGQMYRTITAGSGNMASHASQVERSDRWNAIRYIRKLQGR